MQTLSQANPTINLSTNTNGLKIDIVKQFIEQFQDYKMKLITVSHFEISEQ